MYALLRWSGYDGSFDSVITVFPETALVEVEAYKDAQNRQHGTTVNGRHFSIDSFSIVELEYDNWQDATE